MATRLDLPMPGHVDGVQVHPYWVGAAVTGWLYTCPSHRCGLGRPHHPGRSDTFDSEAEAITRAGDHWNGHQQED